jgi:hypothetical protein
MCDRSHLVKAETADEIRKRKLREVFASLRKDFGWLSHQSLIAKAWPLRPQGSHLGDLVRIAPEFPRIDKRRTG